MDLKDRVAIVTGSARGIGKKISEKLASLGANIVINDILEDVAKQTAEEIGKNFGVKTIGIKCDVSNSSDVEALIKKTIEEFGKIDIIVNNAGITRDNLLMRMKEEDWDMVLNINLKSAFLVTKAAIRHMLKNKYGKIVNIASIVGLIGNPGQANYSASKGGLIALTKTMAREFAAKNINVNAVAPGFIDTDMTKKLPEQAREALISQIPMKRLGQVEDIANAVAFLCSEESSYITGQCISVNGGMAM